MALIDAKLSEALYPLAETVTATPVSVEPITPEVTPVSEMMVQKRF